MADLNHLLHLRQAPVTAAFLAARAMADCRAEWDKVLSLVEAGLAEAAEAAVEGTTDSQSWKRAVNIGRVLRDVAIANQDRVAKLERKVSLLAMLEAGEIRKKEARDDRLADDAGDGG